MSQTAEARRQERPIITAADGVGPLIDREYVAEVEGASCEPEEVGRKLRTRFVEYAPPETAVFHRQEGDADRPLEPGDELEIRLSLLGCCGVRVVDTAPCTLTMRTLKGHPEAGRITFGAGRAATGNLILAIRSRTRASSVINFAGYVVMGKQMQSRCWIRFLDRLAADCGGKIVGPIRVRTHHVDDEPADREPTGEPTFACTADPDRRPDGKES